MTLRLYKKENKLIMKKTETEVRKEVTQLVTVYEAPRP